MCFAFKMCMSDHMCNCACFPSYISFHCVILVCLCIPEPPGQHAGISESFILIYLILFPPLSRYIGFTVSPSCLWPGRYGYGTPYYNLSFQYIVGAIDWLCFCMQTVTVHHITQRWKTAQRLHELWSSVMPASSPVLKQFSMWPQSLVKNKISHNDFTMRHRNPPFSEMIKLLHWYFMRRFKTRLRSSQPTVTNLILYQIYVSALLSRITMGFYITLEHFYGKS